MQGNTSHPFGANRIGVLAAGGAHADESCFADDVVVDFPSMAAAVDRMRHAFLAEESPAALRRGIRLTRREARTGAVVPLDIPVRCTCPECGGRGESWAESCLRCGGSGTELLMHPVEVTVPAGVSDGAQFSFVVTVRHHPPTRVELRITIG